MEGRGYKDIQIRLEGIRYAVNGKEILRGVDLEIKEGKVYLLVGRNGSGKTTLLKVIAGLLVVSSGRIFINGELVEDPWVLKSICGYIFQNPQMQVIGSTVEEDVAFGLENMGLPHDIMEERIEEVLREVGLMEQRYMDPILLSGGQLQRLAIASILALKPRFLLLDEPLSMLDSYASEEVVSVLKRLKGRVGIVIASHELDPFDFVDEIIYMKDGKAKVYSPEKFFSSNVHDVKYPSWASSL